MCPAAAQSSPPSESYPRQYETSARFKGHLEIFFRPIRAADADLLRELFRSHSKETILHRYFAPLGELSPEQMTSFVDLDYKKDMAIIGLVPFQDRQRMICVGRFFRDASVNSAEIAITVHDDYQRRGIGTFLLQTLIRAARDLHIETLTADVLSDNRAMMRLLRNCSNKLAITLDAGVYHIAFPVGRKRSN
jgi:acetyltransferase